MMTPFRDFWRLLGQPIATVLIEKFATLFGTMSESQTCFQTCCRHDTQGRGLAEAGSETTVRRAAA